MGKTLKPPPRDFRKPGSRKPTPARGFGRPKPGGSASPRSGEFRKAERPETRRPGGFRKPGGSGAHGRGGRATGQHEVFRKEGKPRPMPPRPEPEGGGRLRN